MQDLAQWLEELGMSEYAQCFAENKIDVSVLRYLTDQDLKDMGVPLGHRRKMLAAVAKFEDGSAAGASSALRKRRRGCRCRLLSQDWKQLANVDMLR